MRGFILTYCPSPDALYGNLLTAKTLRTGFPTTNILVVDNASAPEVRPTIKAVYESVGCQYYQLEQKIPHAKFLWETVFKSPDTSIVFLDPDLMFWGNMEKQRYSGLMHGRKIPPFYDPYTKCNNMERLHTSLLFLPDVEKLKAFLASSCKNKFDFDPFYPVMLYIDGSWRRWDTGAALYFLLGDGARAFTEEDLVLYDHLFCGTHLHELPIEVENSVWQDWFAHAHQAAREGNLDMLRGVYVKQEEFFKSSVWK